jgi:hypothetical protein
VFEMATAGYARTPYSPTRFPAGITNANQGDATSNLGKPDETKFYTDFEDFFVYTAGNWSVAGTPTAAAAAGAGGILSLTIGAAAAYLRRSVASFTLVAGKRCFFKVKVSMADVANTIFFAGLVNAGATEADATDGIFFTKPDTASTFSVSVRKNATTGANNETGLGEVLDGVATVLAFEYDGKQSVNVYQDDVKLATLDASSAYFPDTNLQLAFGGDDGAGGTNEVILIDYIYACVER